MKYIKKRNINIYPLEKRKSKISGYGIFARRDINKGEFLSWYYGKRYNINDVYKYEKYKIYLMSNSANRHSVMAPDKHTFDSKYIGQYANDINLIKNYDINEINSYIKSISQCNSICINGVNTLKTLKPDLYKLIKPFFNKIKDKKIILKYYPLFAIKDIKKDEEIYLNYGVNYWLFPIMKYYIKNLYFKYQLFAVVISVIIFLLIYKHINKKNSVSSEFNKYDEDNQTYYYK